MTFDPAMGGMYSEVCELRAERRRSAGGRRTPDEVRQEYRYLEHDDIDQCLAYAAWKLDERDDVLG